jgi:hypothetical protein
MIATSGLVDLPFAFTQRALLRPDQFSRELATRGLTVSESGLEQLHRARVLVPFLRVWRDARRVRRAFQRDDPWAWEIAHWEPTSPSDLAQAQAAGRISDPASERFLPPRQRIANVGEGKHQISAYLYSQSQMTVLPVLQEVLPHIVYETRHREVTAKLSGRRWLREIWLEQLRSLRETAVAVCALEAAYYPGIVGRARFEHLSDFDAYDAWRRKAKVRAAMTLLGVKAAWFANTGNALLAAAARRDPLGRWAELLGHADPEVWTELKGDARIALDLRIAAEVLLRYHEDLVKARQAKKLAPARRRRYVISEGRLLPHRTLDETLTDLGLSPHPRLVLVVEGDTELLLVPRVMRHFEMRIEDDAILIQSAEGVNKDLAALMGFVAPRVATEEDGRYLELTRPPTRVLAVLDPEGPASTPESREELRIRWRERIMRALPHEYRTDAVRDQINLLVEVATWNKRGESFEFAHFTDRQIASAIVALPGHRRTKSVAEVAPLIASLRDKHANLASAVPRRSKVALAQELWPILERKLARAEQAKTETKIPVVRVLDRALELAQEFPRRGLVIGLRRD